VHAFLIQNIPEVPPTLSRDHWLFNVSVFVSRCYDGDHFLEGQNARKPFQILGPFVLLCSP